MPTADTQYTAHKLCPACGVNGASAKSWGARELCQGCYVQQESECEAYAAETRAALYGDDTI